MVPHRSEVAVGNTWDLAPLYPDAASWEGAFTECKGFKGRMPRWKGQLSQADSLAKALEDEREIDLLMGESWSICELACF